MTPDVPMVLAELAQLVMRNAAPDVPDAERASALGLTALLLSMTAEIWDGAAHTLVEDNRAMRALLSEDGHDQDLRLSSLRAANAALRARLIAAQVAAESAGDIARQDAIWAELRASTERRKLSTSLI